MITTNQIHSLGYQIKTGELHGGGIDYSHPTHKGYLVHLQANNSVSIIFPNNSQKNSITFAEFERFESWHNEFKKEHEGI